ncbi:MAG: MBL fold metallo-hydrolase [Oscillospiraceae bacterium]|nr:MBL fold metallo-hydrolase [Oscillospiraceae bacterium]
MDRKLTVTVLVENTAPEGLEAEHGLSFWLDYGGECWLLDAGQTDLFAKNAEVLGIDLKRARGAILSHGHYDHSGGFPAYFRAVAQGQLFLRPSCREGCWHEKEDGLREIGIPGPVLSDPSRLCWEEGRRELSPGLWLIPHSAAGLERRGLSSRMYRRRFGRLVPDDFSHEQSLVVETERGLILLSSCSHAGIDTAVEETLAVFPGKRVIALLGGFHLGLKGLTYPPEQVRTLARRLTELGVEEIWTGHCTGQEGYAVLKEELGPRLHRLTTGLRLSF